MPAAMENRLRVLAHCEAQEKVVVARGRVSTPPFSMHRNRSGWYALPIAQQLCLHVFRVSAGRWAFGATESHKQFDPDKHTLSTWPSKREAMDRAAAHCRDGFS